jgi:UDP-N-acetylglucosamine 2-epimerase (non-hydrolysing)
MAERIRIACVLGTRPEAIKMAPVIRVLRACDWAQCQVVATAQHRGLLDQILGQLGIEPDVDLDLMSEGQSMVDLTSRMLPALADALGGLRSQAVLAQGDTTTVFVASLAAYYAGLPFGHVEAGLRTRDLREPFPEEGFRQMSARLARWNFAPTAGAADNLAQEALAADSIFVTGNTGIDALLQASAALSPEQRLAPSQGGRLILLTAHRRESFGRPMAGIFAAVRRVVDRHEDVRVLYPVHPNPNVSAMAHDLLGGHPRIELCEPMDYFGFVAAMNRCHLVLTDSGGIQEEAPALGKPVLVLREKTERPEAVACGAARLVGVDEAAIVAATSTLLDDAAAYRAMAIGVSPYGDGQAAPRIEAILRAALSPAR